MFAEYLHDKTWQTVMPGVSVCYLDGTMEPGSLPISMEKAHSEVLYCTGGSLHIIRRGGSEVQVEAKEILLVSDCSHIEQATVVSPLEGILIQVDRMGAQETFHLLCSQFHIPLSMKRVGEHMLQEGGFRAVPVTPWSRAVFYAMKRLPKEERSKYCILKTFELLYLFCNQETEAGAAQRELGNSAAAVAISMKAYMENHLEEKLTITDLSRKFHLSRTACKSAFRSCFDQPIHSWLLDRRMERAAELLEKTKMPILQVAQSVGYTGVSQFNVAFRQRYGKSPREYRKMSVSVAF